MLRRVREDITHDGDSKRETLDSKRIVESRVALAATASGLDEGKAPDRVAGPLAMVLNPADLMAIREQIELLTKDLMKFEIPETTSIEAESPSLQNLRAILSAHKRELEEHRDKLQIALLQASKQWLAEVLLAEIENIGRETLARAARELRTRERQEIIDRFNRQFNGFAEIETGPGVTPALTLAYSVADFTTASLNTIRERMQRLLRSTDDHGRLSDNYKKICTVLSDLAKDNGYLALLLAPRAASPVIPFTFGLSQISPEQIAADNQQPKSAQIIAIQIASMKRKLDAREALQLVQFTRFFRWNPGVPEISPEQIAAYNRQRDPAQTVATEIASMKSKLGELDWMRLTYQRMVTHYSRAKREQIQDVYLSEALLLFRAFPSYKEAAESTIPQPMNGFDTLQHDLLKGLSQLKTEVQRVVAIKPNTDKERLKLLSDCRLYIHVARSSHQLYEAIQQAKIAYHGSLPKPVLQKLMDALQIQADLIENLVRPAPAELTRASSVLGAGSVRSFHAEIEVKREVDSSSEGVGPTNVASLLRRLDAAVADLELDKQIASQLGCMLTTAISDHHYWHEQLCGSSLRKKADLPTGIAEMQRLVLRMETENENWANDPATVKHFLSELKRIASVRLAYKNTIFCGLFVYRPLRNDNLSKFYQFLTNLNPEKISISHFQEAEQLHAVITALATKTKQAAALFA